MSEVKQRVIARVTGQEYKPTTVVAITEDQEVVDKAASVDKAREMLGIDPTPEEQHEADLFDVVNDRVNSAYDPWPEVVDRVQSVASTQRAITAGEMVGRFKQLNPDTQQPITVNLTIAEDDRLTAYELGISVQAYRHFQSAVDRLGERIDSVVEKFCKNNAETP